MGSSAGTAAFLQLALSDRDISSAQDDQDAPGGSWFWGSNDPILHTTVVNNNVVLPRHDKRGFKHFAKDHEARYLGQRRGLKPLPTSLSESCNSSNNQSARLVQRNRRDDLACEAQIETSSTHETDSGEQVLHLPPIGISSQHIQSQQLRKTSHAICDGIVMSDAQKNASREVRASTAKNCALWGPCLDEAVSSFQATEIILVAEIDADERCMSFLKQQVQLNIQQNQQYQTGGNVSKHRRSPRLTQLELKLAALEKKLFMNKAKLVSVRDRLEELKASGDANRFANDNSADERTCSDNSGDKVTADHVLDDRISHLPTHGEISQSTKMSLRKKRKRHKRRRSSEPEQQDGIISNLQAVLTIQKAFRKFKQALRWKDAIAATSIETTNKSRLGSSRSNQSLENAPAGFDACVVPSPCSLESAAVRIQSLYRRRAGRAALRHLLAEVYEKVFDPDSNSYYYYSKRTKQSQWEKPVLLGDHDLADLPKPAQEIENAEPSDPFFPEHHQAAQAIQRLYRNRAMRLFLRDLATGTLQKVFDADFGAWYYFNHRTQQSFWEKPQHAQIAAAREPLVTR